MKNGIVKIISLGILIAGLLGVMALSGGDTKFAAYLDQPSLYVILVFTISMLIFSNTFGDYIMAIKIAAGNPECTTNEMKAALNAMDLSIVLVFLSGIIGGFIGAIVILASVNEAADIRHSFSVDFIVILYSLIINLIQVSIRAKVKKELIYRG